MAPSTDFGDAGEFAACSASLALPHPSSYPLYCLAGKAWGALVPLGSWSYRMNLFSLALGLATVLLLAACGRRLGLGELPSLFGAALFALSPEAARAFTGTEVFALHLFWAALGAWLVLALPRPAAPPGLALLGLWLGLGLGNHHTLVLVLPPLAWLAWRRGGLPSGRAWVWGAAAFALGLSIYLFLPLRSSRFPPMDWGHPTSPAALARVILRQDYGSASLTVEGALPRSPKALASQLARFASFSLSELGWPALLLALWGTAAWSAAPSALWALAWLALAGPLFFCLGNPPFTAELDGALGRFYLLAWLPLAWLWASGLEALSRRLGAWAPAAVVLAAFPLARAAAAAVPRWNLAAYDFGRSLQAPLPEGAALFLDGGDDSFYTFAERQLAQGRRRDVEVHDRGGLVFPSAYGSDFRSLPKDHKEERRRSVESAMEASRPLYYASMNAELLPGRRVLPLGVVQRPFAEGHALKGTELYWPDEVLRLEPGLLESRYRHRALAPYLPFMRGWSLAELGDLDAALVLWRRARLWGPDVGWLGTNLPSLLENLGYRAGAREDWAACSKLYAFRLESFPSSGQPWANYAGCLERQGELERSAAASLKAAQVEPKLAQAHANLGTVRWRQQRWADAALAFERASELKPGDEGYRKYAGEARARAGAKR